MGKIVGKTLGFWIPQRQPCLSDFEIEFRPSAFSCPKVAQKTLSVSKSAQTLVLMGADASLINVARSLGSRQTGPENRAINDLNKPELFLLWKQGSVVHRFAC